MGLLWTRKKATKTQDKNVVCNQEQIKENVKQLKVVAVKLENNKEYADKVLELAESYQYATPKKDDLTYAKEKKIASKIGDMHVAVAKATKTSQYDEIDDLLLKIKVLIAER